MKQTCDITCDKAAGSSRWALLVLALLCAAMFLPGLGSSPLVDPDEARCGLVAGEMLRTGQWLMPHLEGSIYWDKPAPFFWMAAGVQWVTGSIEPGGRVVAVAAATALVFVAFFWARRLGGTRAGLLAGAVLATSVMFVQMARWYRMDMPLAACIVAAMWWFWRYESPRRESPWRWVGFYVFCALACLMKGPAGLGMPVLVVAGYLVLTRQGRRIGEFFNFWGIVAFVLIASPWFVAVSFRYPSYFDEFFMQQNVARFASGKFEHTLFGVGYIAILFFTMMPWMAFLPGAVRMFRPAGGRPGMLRRRYARLSARVNARGETPLGRMGKMPMPHSMPQLGLAGRMVLRGRVIWRVATWRVGCMESGRLFVALAVLIPLAILIAAKTQMAPYILPLFAPMAVVLSLPISEWLAKEGEFTRADRRLAWGIMIILPVVVAVLAAIEVAAPQLIGMLSGAQKVDMKAALAAVRELKMQAGWLDWSLAAAGGGLAVAIAAMMVALRRRRRGAFLAATVVGLVLVIGLGLTHTLGAYYQESSLRTLMAGLPADGPGQRRLCSWGPVRLSATLYGGASYMVRMDPDFSSPETLVAFLRQPGSYCLWTDSKDDVRAAHYIELGKFEQMVREKYHAAVVTIGEKGNHRLIRIVAESTGGARMRN